ncbi:MAG TPA: molybdenum cofactor biosynthesis protein MoaE [Dehalococcoidia bacterium]|nr:molybdenum cofactor biosynthesis protein MoaE [Dehalococcoidia bacterium]
MRSHVRVHGDAVDVAALMRLVSSPASGATASFVGTVRDHNDDLHVTSLEYEAYVPIAERSLQRIALLLGERHDLEAIAIEHRTGMLAVGDVAVAVVAAAVHRHAALAACSEAIDLIKREVPIWKREHHPDGARWLDGCSDVVEEAEHGETRAHAR